RITQPRSDHLFFFGAEMVMARRVTRLGWVAILLGFINAAPAQNVSPAMSPPPQAGGPMPPLLYIKLIGPAGMQATFFDASAQGKPFAAPCTIGVRPGYCARLALSGIPDHPNAVFFPNLHVCGSPFVSNSADFPAALVF